MKPGFTNPTPVNKSRQIVDQPTFKLSALYLLSWKFLWCNKIKDAYWRLYQGMCLSLAGGQVWEEEKQIDLGEKEQRKGDDEVARSAAFPNWIWRASLSLSLPLPFPSIVPHRILQSHGFSSHSDCHLNITLIIGLGTILIWCPHPQFFCMFGPRPMSIVPTDLQYKFTPSPQKTPAFLEPPSHLQLCTSYNFVTSENSTFGVARHFCLGVASCTSNLSRATIARAIRQTLPRRRENWYSSQSRCRRRSHRNIASG